VLLLRVPLALLAALFALLAVAAPAQAAFPGRNGVIAYQARSSAHGVFEARKADGSGFRRVVATGAVSDPAFSPGGRRLAFTRSRAIWVMQADGTGQRRLVAQPVPEGEPTWSPRGDMVAFAAGRSARRQLFTVGADALGLTRITARPGADDRSPAWSATGRIAFVRRVKRGNDDLWTLDAPGRAPRRLTRTSADDAWPSWSPDGRRLAFVRGTGTRRDLYVMDADGGRLRRLTRLASTVATPAWSPDGRSLAFALGVRGKRQLWTMRSDGRKLRRLTRGRADPTAPDWQPAAGDPVIAAAGDIACDPVDPNWGGGLGNARRCHQLATSNLLLRRDLDAVLALGDLQYERGPYANFLASFGQTWGRLKNIMRPVPGNHEYLDPGAAGYFDYFNGPGQVVGQAGRRDQGGFYSFDLGTWHVVALNSECGDAFIDPTGSSCAPGSPQERWLRADLAAHRTRCTLAMWHHPLFTSGEEGSSPPVQPLWQALYDLGADVVLNGHAHAYERFEPMDALGGPDPARGVREFVVGTGGKSHQPLVTVQPNSEVRDISTFGVLQMRLRATGYDWTFLPDTPGGFTDGGSATCH
jgi:acid phosphatase type 7